MNLVGKILVVALLVMSLVFASMVLAVHATHTQWNLLVSNTDKTKGKPGLMQDVADRDTQIQRLLGELFEKTKLYERTVRESEQVRGSLESQNQELLAARAKLRTEIDDTTARLKEAINAAQLSGKVLETTQGENKVLRDDNVTIKKERDDALAKAQKDEEDLAQAKGQWTRYEARNKQLLAQLAEYRQVIQNAGLTLNLDIPKVEGLVTKTHTTEKMVEINLGSDHGLKDGVVMDVYRIGSTLSTTSYLGKIRLFKTDKTTAVGSVIQDSSLKGTIQENDHVSTRIK